MIPIYSDTVQKVELPLFGPRTTRQHESARIMISPPFQYGLKGMSRENFGGHTKNYLIFLV